MVSLAAKELLKKSVKTATFHNKILEENDMWRQWELEQGLTMMVSDDAIKKRSKHLCKYHAEKRKREMEKAKQEHRKRSMKKSEKPKSLAESLDRWDHSGFEELYPGGSYEEERRTSRSTDSRNKSRHTRRQKSPSAEKQLPRKRSDRERWGHNGYKKMYPDEFRSGSHYKSCCSSSASSSSSSSISSSGSESEYHQRKRRRKHRREPSSSSTYSTSSETSSISSYSRSSRSRSRERIAYETHKQKKSSSLSKYGSSAGSHRSHSSHKSSHKRKVHRNHKEK